MIYLVCFAASLFFAGYAQKANSRRNFYIFSALSILLPVLLAGLRDYSIGIDTDSYLTLERYWQGAISADSLWAYMKYYLSLGYGEPLFALLLGTVAQLFGNFTVFLFLVHGVIIVCLYVGAFRLRQYVSPVWILLFFYLVYYGQSLNIMRQYMAVAICFAAFADILQKKWLRYCIMVAIAAMIHITAVLALFPLVIYFILNVRWSLLDRKKWFRWGIVIGISLMALLLLEPVVRLLMNIGLLNDKYLFYFQKKVISPAVLDSIFWLVGFCGVFLFWKKIQARCEHASFFAINGISYFLLMQFSWIIIYGKRLAAYQMFPALVSIALLESAQTTKTMKWIVRAGFLAAGIIYWLYVYVLRNASQIMPYQFVF